MESKLKVYHEPALILRHDEVLGRISNLFENMRNDPHLERTFIENPAQAIYAHITRTHLPAQQASVTNQLLFSILANDNLLAWLRGYVAGHRENAPDRHQFMHDFGRAVVQHGGDHVVLALLRALITQKLPVGLGEEVYFLISDSPIIASGSVIKTNQRQEQKQTLPQDQRSNQNFEQSTPQNVPATQANPTTQGLSGSDMNQTQNQDQGQQQTQNQSQDQAQDQAQGQSQGQEQDGGKFNADDFGIYTSSYVRATIEALVAHAKQLEAAGHLNTMPLVDTRE